MKWDVRQSHGTVNAGGDSLIFDATSIMTLDYRLVVKAFGKILLMLSVVACLIIYQKYNHKKLNSQKALISAELTKLQAKKNSLESMVEKYKDKKVVFNEFNNKLKIMQNIVNIRLLAIEGLDNIQANIPEKVWLKEIDFSNKKFTIKGSSVNAKEIQKFAASLENVGFFDEVRVSSMTHKSNKEENTLRDFVINSSLRL